VAPIFANFPESYLRHSVLSNPQNNSYPPHLTLTISVQIWTNYETHIFKAWGGTYPQAPRWLRQCFRAPSGDKKIANSTVSIYTRGPLTNAAGLKDSREQTTVAVERMYVICNVYSLLFCSSLWTRFFFFSLLTCVPETAHFCSPITSSPVDRFSQYSFQQTEKFSN